MELEFATTQEIIKELLNRTTFAGIIIASSKELKNNNMELDEWEIFIKNLSKTQSENILRFMTEKIQEIE